MGWMGLSTDQRFIPLVAVSLSASFLGVLFLFEGNIGFALLTAVLFGIGWLTLVRPDLSFILMGVSVLLFDQYQIPGFEPWTFQAGYLNNLKEIRYLPYFHIGMMTPMEIHLALILMVTLVRPVLEPAWGYRSVEALGPATLLFVWVLVSLAGGLARGGDLMISLWETRALVTFFVIYWLTPQLIRSTSQIRFLLWGIFAAIGVKALQALARFVSLGLSTGGYQTLTSHEDAIFFNTLFLLCLGFLFFRVKDAQRTVLIGMLGVLALGFILAMRRAGYASLMVSGVGFFVLLAWPHKRRILKLALPLVISMGVYAAAGWNSSHPLAEPVQMVKSGVSKSSLDVGSEEYWSNLYRNIENYNLSRTILANPVIGTGFGRPYEMPVPLANISFPLRDYIPHNQILWVFTKMGGVGFLLFWFFFLSVVMRAVQYLHQTRSLYLKAVMMLCALSVVNQMVASFFDLQLTFTRNMVYLGMLLGLVSVYPYLMPREERNATS